MIPELGQLSLILAAQLAFLMAALPLWGVATNNIRLMSTARSLAFGQLLLVSLAFALLTSSFVLQDFSVLYVANNSNSLLPMLYRFSAVWGAHEGSLLLWVLILSIWTAMVARFSRSLPIEVVARVLAVLGLISLGFLLFTVIASNPFDRLLPSTAEGRDLNPLLQDPGLIFHPPMQYAGYVGFAVPFAFAIASLLSGQMDDRWVRWSRPWTNVAWAFLTAGIALGSWWAYYELGWGGWWFWDPAENAAFMPWLVGTALIHSQAVTEKRGSFRNWTLLLAIAAFSLSLLGTFLIRSGVLTSVHAFAADPERGVFILGFLAVVVGGSLLLFGLRANTVAAGKSFAPLSRDTLLLLNNLLFSVAAVMVLIGTLYPLLADALDLGKMSVGPPYFSALFILLMAPVVLLMPFGPFTRWASEQWGRFVPLLRVALSTTAVLCLFAWLGADASHWKTFAGVTGATWLIVGTLQFVWKRFREAPSGRRFTAEMLGMVLAHLGMGVFVAGVMIVESTSVERDLALRAGESAEFRGYRFEFEGVAHQDGPNYSADHGSISVYVGERKIASMHPERRAYASGGQIMTEAAIDPGLFRDLYVALGEPLDGGDSWAVRVYVKPFIRWIWLGALMMMAGGFIAAMDRRFRRHDTRQATSAISNAAVEAIA